MTIHSFLYIVEHLFTVKWNLRDTISQKSKNQFHLFEVSNTQSAVNISSLRKFPFTTKLCHISYLSFSWLQKLCTCIHIPNTHIHTYAHQNQTNSNERNFHPAEWESRHVLWKCAHTHHASNSTRGNWIAYGKNPWPCVRFFVCASFCFSYLLHSHFLAGPVRETVTVHMHQSVRSDDIWAGRQKRPLQNDQSLCRWSLL